MEYCARCLGARAASTVAAQSKTRVAVLLTLGQIKLDTELCEDFVRIHNPAVWEEIPVNTDLCLHIQRCAVQATGKALGTMVLQERARWLADLSDREDNILDMPVVPEGIFGSALASMQGQKGGG